MPEEERIFQENSRGIAFEIHNYSNAFVIADNNSKNVANIEIYADLINDTYEECLKLHFSKKAEP